MSTDYISLPFTGPSRAQLLPDHPATVKVVIFLRCFEEAKNAINSPLKCPALPGIFTMIVMYLSKYHKYQNSNKCLIDGYCRGAGAVQPLKAPGRPNSSLPVI